MALTPHLYTLAFYFTVREKVGGTEEKEGDKQNDGETDAWNTLRKCIRGRNKVRKTARETKTLGVVA